MEKAQEPWGRTGRVTLNPLYPGVLTEVYVDDELVGHVYDDDLYAWDCHRWGFSPLMPTADHALGWLLRRAAPDVWRAERPDLLPPRPRARLGGGRPSRARRSRVARPMTPLPRGLRRLATFRIRPPRVRPTLALLNATATPRKAPR